VVREEEHPDRKENIGGPGCVDCRGYSGHRISLAEMKGCRAIQCLLMKTIDWKPEPDDQDFELDGRVFLTGVGDGSPDMAPLEIISPVRHVSVILGPMVPTSGVSTPNSSLL
jgi:hypothetical protein